LYVDYVKSADWVGNDFYAVTGYNRPDWLWKIGAAVDRLRDWGGGGKPQFAMIESSAQRLSWTPRNTRGVTADELRGEVWHAVIHGVRGIIYFPQQIGEGFRYDATPPKVALEMSRQNRRLNEMGDVLAGEVNPKAYAVKGEPPLEAGWRAAGDGRLFVIVLNFSDDNANGKRVEVGGIGAVKASVVGEDRDVAISGGAFTDNFGPYGVRIYQLAASK
jgi:hypothetical protein